MARPLENFKVGDLYESNNFGTVQVVENKGSRNVTVRFLNTGTISSGLQRGNVIRGNVKDFFVPTIEGVGFLGTDRKVNKLPSYRCWKHMIVRCYSKNYHSTRGTYEDCSVCVEWHNFCNFEMWFDENYVEGYHLDKDLLLQGNKIYSPETCCFIPAYINSSIVEKGKDIDGCETGVSKRRKKGSTEYNGLYNVQFSGIYLGRTPDLSKANELYRDFKKLYLEEVADKFLEVGMISSTQAECLRTRKSIKTLDILLLPW